MGVGFFVGILVFFRDPSISGVFIVKAKYELEYQCSLGLGFSRFGSMGLG